MLDIGLQSIPIQLISGCCIVPICNKKTWQKILTCNPSNADTMCRVLLNGSALPPSDERYLLVQLYIQKMEEIRERFKINLPKYPVKKNKDDIKYGIFTFYDKLVADYANMSIYDIDKLPILDYWLLEYDAFIRYQSSYSEGREYLNNAYRLTQTEADDDLEI